MAEVSESPEKPVDTDAVVEDTINGLIATGLIEGPNQVSHTRRHRVEYAYPTPRQQRDEILSRLLPELAKTQFFRAGGLGRGCMRWAIWTIPLCRVWKRRNIFYEERQKPPCGARTW